MMSSTLKMEERPFPLSFAHSNRYPALSPQQNSVSQQLCILELLWLPLPAGEQLQALPATFAEYELILLFGHGGCVGPRAS